jgi:hypothetical protein
LKVTRVTILDVEPSHICIYIVDVNFLFMCQVTEVT